MFGVDTRLIVRLLTRDDHVQHRSAVAVFDTEEVLIPTTVVLETEWMLRIEHKKKAGPGAVSFCVSVTNETRPASL